MLLGTFACKCLCGHTCSFLLGMHWLFRLATDTTPEELTEDALMEMNASRPVPDHEQEDKGEAASENKLILENLAEEF